MRTFIISDIHGNGNLYYSVMSYLDNISNNENITLYINGDLIDRGIESGEILLDVINRINNPKDNFKIVYLAGNHELMMYQEYQNRIKGVHDIYNLWYDNGGYYTDFYLEDTVSSDEILKIIDFIGNLDIYHLFNEKIGGKPIVLVHASVPLNVLKECPIKIKDNNINTEYVVWARKNDPYIPFKCRIGNDNYFTIIGHTPNNNKRGYEYHQNGNYLNIDGGSAYYVSGFFKYDHYPLVEIKNNYLRILTFNNNNEITYGNYFINGKSFSMKKEELIKERELLNNDLKPKKLIKLPDGIIGYSDWL